MQLRLDHSDRFPQRYRLIVRLVDGQSGKVIPKTIANIESPGQGEP